MEKKKKKEDDRSPDTNPSPGDPVYGADQDIYSRAKREAFEEDNTDAENKRKTPMPGDGLDIPGAELDDAEEAIGEEDEENNYYSLGGDEHNDLEEEGAEPDR